VWIYDNWLEDAVEGIYLTHSAGYPYGCEDFSIFNNIISGITGEDRAIASLGGSGHRIINNTIVGDWRKAISLEDANVTGIAGAANNGSGLIRITTSTAHVWNTGDPVYIGGVTGTTEANGQWTMTKVDNTHLDLDGSTFENAWVSGGVISSIGCTGATVKNNITYKPSAIDAATYNITPNAKAGLAWDYNIVFAPGVTASQLVSYDGSYHTWAQWQGHFDANGKNELPTFVDSSSLTYLGGFDPQLSSLDTVAKNAGTAGIWAFDKVETPRPQGASWDIGAYEQSGSDYTITPSVAGTPVGGTISPAVAQVVAADAQPAFTINPYNGWLTGSVAGTCGGSLVDYEYTISAAAADCTVVWTPVQEYVVPW
jgi:hypothetical protein